MRAKLRKGWEAKERKGKCIKERNGQSKAGNEGKGNEQIDQGRNERAWRDGSPNSYRTFCCAFRLAYVLVELLCYVPATYLICSSDLTVSITKQARGSVGP